MNQKKQDYCSLPNKAKTQVFDTTNNNNNVNIFNSNKVLRGIRPKPATLGNQYTYYAQ